MFSKLNYFITKGVRRKCRAEEAHKVWVQKDSDNVMAIWELGRLTHEPPVTPFGAAVVVRIAGASDVEARFAESVAKRLKLTKVSVTAPVENGTVALLV
ncbi:unnamed protein product [Protopolystoma xenopodis]|uniref:Uncharacterized protein n=1 Tax=Protopolystoma xenopodis TaxID=117903 RepID=A0A448X2G8_9PLAT|nr:unnamed protein product [Protopolystoma xenopodis]